MPRTDADTDQPYKKNSKKESPTADKNPLLTSVSIKKWTPNEDMLEEMEDALSSATGYGKAQQWGAQARGIKLDKPK